MSFAYNPTAGGGSSGGGETLAQTLAIGNTTGANNLVVSANQDIVGASDVSFTTTTGTVSLGSAGTDYWRVSTSGNLEKQIRGSHLLTEVKVDPTFSNPRSVLHTDSFSVFTNQNVAGTGVYNLPAASSGIMYTFCMIDAKPVQIVPHANSRILFANTITAAATGYIQGVGRGTSTTLVGISSSGYLATSIIGSWTVYD